MNQLLPLYQCHKKVRAFKITAMEASPDGSLVALLGGQCNPPYRVEVTAGYMLKHTPQVGDYYVLYDDGYESRSPAEPFEDGYTSVPGVPVSGVLPQGDAA